MTAAGAASPSRRRFLQQLALLAPAGVLATPLEALALRWRERQPLEATAYGPLIPARDATTGLYLLDLPPGFRYLSCGWRGDLLSSGTPTPALHDGMACFAAEGARVRLVRNHEVSLGTSFAATVYDPGAGGGTTTLTFDTAAEQLIESVGSLSGTVRNCAGGSTPWGSWLTCEETVNGPDVEPRLTHPHGFVFDVPATGAAAGVPLTKLGRFSHEAVAVDPATGIVYQTEDAGSAGLYRFVPRSRGDLSSGTLQMLAVKGQPQLDLRGGQAPDARYAIEWVDIADPERPHDAPKDGSGVFMQGSRAGGTTFARLEGASFSSGLLHVTATSGGAAKMGQVWELHPERGELRLVIESPGAHVLNMPDNLCPSPHGGLIVCEDGTTNPRVLLLSRDGLLSPLIRNSVILRGERNKIAGDFRHIEFAGATFSPDGRWLFVNVQTPGITFAVTGPWQSGRSAPAAFE